MQSPTARSAFAKLEKLQFRLRAAGKLIGVTDTTMRTYADNTGLKVLRANEINPGAPAVRIFSVENLFEIAAWRRENGYIKRPARHARPQVISVYVAKGGTAKTTTAVETAVHLQLLGLRVLVVDLDFQANATALMGYEADLTQGDAAFYGVNEEAIVNHTFASILKPFLAKANREPVNSDDLIDYESIVKKPYGLHGPHLIPSDTYLADAESKLSYSRGHRELYVKKLLDTAYKGELPYFKTDGYDVIIFDCAPSVNFLSSAALTASDFVIAPIRLDSFSIKGLNRLVTELEVFADEFAAQPELVILPTYFSPQLSRVGRMQNQLHAYVEHLAPLSISASEEFPKSLEGYIPLSLQKPSSNGASEYQKFAEFMRDKLVAAINKESVQ